MRLSLKHVRQRPRDTSNPVINTLLARIVIVDTPTPAVNDKFTLVDGTPALIEDTLII